MHACVHICIPTFIPEYIRPYIHTYITLCSIDLLDPNPFGSPVHGRTQPSRCSKEPSSLMMLRQKPTEYIPRDIKGTPDGGNWVSLGGVKGITESFNGFVLKVCGFSRACPQFESLLVRHGRRGWFEQLLFADAMCAQFLASLNPCCAR